jgi:hypothetical protein
MALEIRWGAVMIRTLRFLLGLPMLAEGPLWRAARALDAPILISANALSVWRRDALGLRHWCAFDRRNLHLVWQHPVHLDSGGFVSAVRYRGFPWTVEHYLDLCAAAPWQWFASADMCVEPEVAHNRTEVLDRISGTARLNRECLLAARARGIENRFVPVAQGWHPHDYLRCLDRMPDISRFPVLGVGSMCRRHVEGDTGILRIVDVLDRALGSSAIRLHLFGIKTTGMAELRDHARIASVDSQAYGVAARQNARKGGFTKSNAYLARVMTDWYRHQQTMLAVRATPFRAPPRPVAPPAAADAGPLPTALAAHLARAAEQLRDLYEAGEIEWTDLNPSRVWDFAFA